MLNLIRLKKINRFFFLFASVDISLSHFFSDGEGKRA